MHLHRVDIKKVFQDHHLPTYVVNSFMKAGFDDVQTISEMDISDGPNNSIDVMERYINQKQFPSCVDNDYMMEGESFEFPPGHKLKITAFIKQIKKQYSTTTVVLTNKGGNKRKLAQAQNSSKAAKSRKKMTL